MFNTGLTMTLDLDPHDMIQPSELYPRNLDHLQSMLLFLKFTQCLTVTMDLDPHSLAQVLMAEVIECE